MFSIKLSNLAQYLGAQLYGDGEIIITSIASMDKAQAGQITFIADIRLHKKLANCKAAAVILTKDYLSCYNGAALIVNNPYLTYARVAQLMDTTPKPTQNIEQSAVISLDVKIGQRVTIGANSVIEAGVILEDDIVIGPGCFIGQNTYIGANTRLWANVSIYHSIVIGKNCLIQSGAVIGSDGFGYANDCGNWIKIPHLGRVLIGNGVEIGASTTIDRGSLDDTNIGNGVIIDNQCQIAHNVMIGNHTAIAGGVIIAGSVKIGNYCMIGGASVINGHITICNKATITGMSMVIRSIINPGIYSSGIPIQTNKEWRKTAALLMNISKISKRIKAIEKKLEKIN